MIYALAALSGLLFITLIVTQVRSGRLQDLLRKAVDDTTNHAQKLQADVDFYIDMMRKAEEKATDLRQQLVNEVRLGDKRVKAARADAVKRSKAVGHGFSSENLAPFNQVRWVTKDFRHMGDPVDYLVVAGMSNVHALGAKAIVDEVVLLDIKTGKAKLNTIQRRIRDAVVAGRVRFAVLNTDTGQLRLWPPDPPPKQLELFT